VTAVGDRLTRLDHDIALTEKAIWSSSPVPPRIIDPMPPVSTRTSIRTPAVHMTTAWASPKVGEEATSRATGSPLVVTAT
jgi:hypothetical protein